ncbi:MAG: U32 family peptidase [Clostridia bacterium]|nr:U32 family peptidase [Clostridia bacterium]
MNNIELLAPAGSPSALKVAIANGCDAVYLGLQDFNARISADNFNTENIREYVKYAHSFGVKVFLTVNTLISNEEMPKFLEMVKIAVEAKVDAYLVQDFGVALVLKSCFKDICLHASTQLGVHNLYGAKVAEKIGFKRVVLSREAKLKDIKEIKQNTNLEIEYFVQGALCIAFSGNCYFSGMMQGDSGNRGRCKQYCRMKYKTNYSDEEKFMLSSRDLCLLKNLKTLIDAGVTSFKIEGRLRRDGYVAQAVKSYRKALDGLNDNFDFEKEEQKLKKVFSRGDFLNSAYLEQGVPDNVVNKDVQNHTGVNIGTVLKTEKFKDLFRVLIKSDYEIKKGDGLKFFDNNQEVASIGVGNAEKLEDKKYYIFTKRNLKPNLSVNLILDSNMEKKAQESVKKIAFSAKIFANAQKSLRCEMSFKDKIIKYDSDFILEKAIKTPTTKDEIILQFSKLGDTDFCLENIEVETDNVFIPKSKLNEFRRNAVQKLLDEIIKFNEQGIKAKVNKEQLNNYKSLLNKNVENQKYNRIFVLNEQNFENFDFAQKDDLIIFSPQSYSLESVKNFCEKFKGFMLGINLPIIANGDDLKILDKILENKDFFVVANNIYGLKYAKTHKVIAGIGLNVFNNFSISHLNALGVCDFVVSIEQQKDKIENIENCFVYSFGYVPLMTFAHCPNKTTFGGNCKNCVYKNDLKYIDVHGKEFKLRRYVLSQCYFELLSCYNINNLFSVSAKKYIDVRNFSLEQLKTLKKGLIEERVFTATNSDIFGKINNSVK